MAVEIFKLFGSIFVNNDEANKSISKTEEKAKSTHSTLADGIATAAKWGTAIVGGATAAASGLTALATSSAATADNVDKMSQKIGVSREAYQELDFICSQSGMEVDKLQNGMKSLVSAMDGAASGTSSNIEQFNKLGISVTDANGNMRSSEDVMWETFSALQGMENQTEKARLATELFGKSGTELMPLLNGASGSIDEMKQQAHDLGLVLSDESIDAGVSLTDTMDQMKRSLSGVVTRLGAELMPILQQVCQAVIDYMPQIISFFDELSPIFSQAFSEIMPTLMELAQQLIPPIIELLKQLMPVISSLLKAIAPIIVQLAEKLLPILVQVIEQLLPPFMEILNSLMPLLNTIFQLVQPFIDLILQLLEPFATLISTALAPLITKLAELLNDLLQPLIPAFNEIASILSSTLQPVFEALAPVFDLLTDALSPLFELLSMLLNAILPALTPVIKILADVFSNVLGLAIKGISGAIESLTGIFNGLIDFIDGVFSGNWDKAWNGILEIFKNVLNLIPNAVEFIINGAIGMINGLFDGINWAIEWAGLEIPHIPEVTLPRFRAGIDYVPNDKYLAYLDAGEAVLTAQEAEQYRKAKQDGSNPFRGNNTDEQKIINIYNSINISGVTVNSDSDIDILAERLSEQLAAEITSKRKEFS